MFSIGRLRYLMAGSAIALLLTGSLRADLTDSLIAHWPFDGDLEDKQGANHGTLMGADDEAVFEGGILGDGIFLDGIDQYVEIDPLKEANFDFLSSNFSVSAWFQVDGFSLCAVVEFERYVGPTDAVDLIRKVQSLALAYHRSTAKPLVAILAYWTKKSAALPDHESLRQTFRRGFDTNEKQRVPGVPDCQLLIYQLVHEQDARTGKWKLWKMIERGNL